MNPIYRYTAFLILSLTIAAGASAADPSDTSVKLERNLIKEGNKLFAEEKFADAEVLYRKALEANPTSETAQYNIASSLLRQARAGQPDSDESKKELQDAMSIMQSLAKDGKNKQLKERSFYNIGNVNFNSGNYDGAIEAYKNALRVNPDNDKARENLRLAQLKKQEQQNQDQNKDQDKDQDKKDQNKDQDKKDHDKNKDQNKDQNKDEQQPPQQPQQPQGGISDDNAEKILKAMENEENATRQRIKARQQQAPPRRAVHGNPW